MENWSRKNRCIHDTHVSFEIVNNFREGEKTHMTILQKCSTFQKSELKQLLPHNQILGHCMLGNGSILGAKTLPYNLDIVHDQSQHHNQNKSCPQNIIPQPFQIYHGSTMPWKKKDTKNISNFRTHSNSIKMCSIDDEKQHILGSVFWIRNTQKIWNKLPTTANSDN